MTETSSTPVAEEIDVPVDHCFPFPLLRLELVFRAEDRLSLPPFRGAFWRGVFGNALAAISRGSGGNVDFGPFAREDIYRAIFDPLAPLGRSWGQEPPPAFVIDAPPAHLHDAIAPGEIFKFGLTLFGIAVEALPAVLKAFSIAAETGLGSSRGKARLISVHEVWRAGGGERDRHGCFDA